MGKGDLNFLEVITNQENTVKGYHFHFLTSLVSTVHTTPGGKGVSNLFGQSVRRAGKTQKLLARM